MSRILFTVLALGVCVAQANTNPLPRAPENRAEGETLVGAVEYQGGFAKLDLNISIKDIVRSFRLAIPKFCKDVEVLQAGTITEGIFDEAKLVNEKDQTYSVNQGTGLRIGGVRLTLNGPAASVCSIPVFLSSKKAPTVSDPDDLDPGVGVTMRSNICNRSAKTAWVSLGYHNYSQWMAKGWWKLTPGQCAWMHVKGNPAYSLYLHGKTSTTSYWGQGPVKFCVQNEAFTVGDVACELGKAGSKWVPMTKLNRSFDGNHYLDLI